MIYYMASPPRLGVPRGARRGKCSFYGAASLIRRGAPRLGRQHFSLVGVWGHQPPHQNLPKPKATCPVHWLRNPKKSPAQQLTIFKKV